MDTFDERLVKVQRLAAGWYGLKVRAVDMLRLDLLHPVVSGNKWYKLKLNVMYAMDHGFKTIVTFGGGNSNHLVATAYATNRLGLGSVGIVRGRYDTLTPTLVDCVRLGMQLIFVTKEEYERQPDPQWVQELAGHFDEIMIIPEGGANELGRKGAGLIARFIKDSYTHIITAVGSGTTFAGIRNKTSPAQHLVGMVPMKEGKYLMEHIAPHLDVDHNTHWQLMDRWHMGGFGKWNTGLLTFMNEFYTTNHIPLDIVYTSKMMYGVGELLAEDFFPTDARILCIHSGGLQGNMSVKDHLLWMR